MTINKLITKYNHSDGTIDRIKYIVIHYVGAVSDARSNAQYFANADRGSSAHYFVGWEGDIWQSVEDQNVAWHSGTKSGYRHPECRNANSIGIEMCCKHDGHSWYFEDATVDTTIELVKDLMSKYSVPVDHVLRHYDITGKQCPAPYVLNNTNHTWEEFTQKIQNEQPKTKLSLHTKLQAKKAVKREVIQVDEKQYIWTRLGELLGVNEFAVAGIMGNLQAESGLRSNNLQNNFEKSLGMDDVQYSDAVSTGAYTREQFATDKAGFGLAQWTYHSRKRAMYDFIVKERGQRIDNLEAQLEFLAHEFNTNYKGIITQLKLCKSVRQASDIILLQYERPANQSESVRQKRAENGEVYYKQYSSGDSQGTTDGKSLEQSIRRDVPTGTKEEFRVRVKISNLNIRKGPGPVYDRIGRYTGAGVFTIVEVVGNWGLLKAYSKTREGWICLNYAERI